VDADATGCVSIGSSAKCDVNADYSIAIGYSTDVYDNTNCIVIGRSSNISSAGAIVIGASASVGNSGENTVVIGKSAESNGTGSIVIGAGTECNGDNSICMGGDVSHNQCIQLGDGGDSYAENEFLVGGSNCSITNVYIGKGRRSSTPQDLTIQSTNAWSVADLAGSNITIRPGAGRGDSVGTTITLDTPNTTTSGTTQHTYTTRMTLKETDITLGSADDEPITLATTVTAEIGFHGATPVAKQTIAGSKGGNVALANLLAALATSGIIVDSTS